jgi:transposase
MIKKVAQIAQLSVAFFLPGNVSRWTDANNTTTSRPVPVPRVRTSVHPPWHVWRLLGRRPYPAAPWKKTVCGCCGQVSPTYYDQRPRRVRDLSCGDRRVYLDFSIRRVRCPWCRAVKTERLDWLANNPFYTKRFAFFVGRRCRDCAIKAVAEDLFLDWHTVKELDKQYMAEQLRRASQPNPRAIGIDEISVGRGHSYRIVVSDLIRGRAIWFGGQDRSEASMDQFFAWLGPEKSSKIRLAVMDMWKAFRNSTLKAGHAPQALIIYDKFHVLRHLQDALDQVRKSEYSRLTGPGRRFIKGQKYALLSRWHNLTCSRKKALKLLFNANKRLHTAYLLKESFEQLWSYEQPGWARRFFDNWRASLKWQRLKPYEKFAAMIEKHWDGIVAYCHTDNKVSLGFVEGLNNKIRVLQRRAYGLRDEEYLRLKILTCTLPKL